MVKFIYLAGPDVFLPNAIEVGRRKVEICAGYGFEGLFPLDQDDSVKQDAAAIFAANCRLMDRADAGVFNLTPFRGPGSDGGTAFELGYMFSQGKPVFGYANSSRHYVERVEAIQGSVERNDGRPIDRNGLLVEDFDLYDNLMLVCSIREAGGALSLIDEDSVPAFEAFGVCLREMKVRLNG
jgi:nucleoside 2-deoxyribosyltransferase